MNKSKWDRWLTICITIAAFIVAIGPLLQPGIYCGTDGYFHLARIEGIYLDLHEGIFPAKIHMAAGCGYGYGCGFFYPDFFLYFPVLLMFLGVSLELAWKIYCIIVMLASFVAAVCAIRIVDRSVPAAWCAFAGACYIMNFRIIEHMYGAESIGSATAMIFIPLALAELLHILWEEHTKWDLLWFTLAVCGMLLSHLTTVIILLAFILMMVLLSLRRLVARPRLILELLGCLVVGSMITIGFWLPMFEQLTAQLFKFQTELLYPVESMTVSFHSAHATLGYGVMLALLASAVMLVVLLIQQRGDARTHMLLVLAVASIVYIVITHYPPFWFRYGYLMEWLQFPQRLLDAPVGGCMILFVVAANMLLRKDCKPLRLGLYLLSCVIAVTFAAQCVSKLSKDDPPEHIISGLITDNIPSLGAGDEWLPDDADRGGLNEPNKSYDPGGEGADGFKHDHSKYYEVYVYLDRPYYDVPYLYYKGYEAYLLDDAGNPVEQLEIGKSDRLAYVRVYMPEGREGIGHVMVTYRKTTVQKFSYVVNVLSVLALLGAIGVSVHRQRKALCKNA